jgi:hypothetical protein
VAENNGVKLPKERNPISEKSCYKINRKTFDNIQNNSHAYCETLLSETLSDCAEVLVKIPNRSLQVGIV